MAEYFDELHARGMKTVMIIDPAVVVDDGPDYWPFETGKAAGVFIEWPNNKSPDFDYTNTNIMLGYVSILITFPKVL
jgi:hypothetical protein